MKDRTIPCIFYVCANADCKKGRRKVTHATACQHCDKYRPRETGNAIQETLAHKKQKIENKFFKDQLKEY